MPLKRRPKASLPRGQPTSSALGGVVRAIHVFLSSWHAFVVLARGPTYLNLEEGVCSSKLELQTSLQDDQDSSLGPWPPFYS